MDLFICSSHQNWNWGHSRILLMLIIWIYDIRYIHIYVYNTLQYRLLSEALVLTGADICSAVKPWDVQYPTAMDVFSEYHDQVIPLISHLVSQKKLPFFGSTNFYVSFPKNLSLLVFFGSDRSPRQTQPNGVMWVWERSKEDERAWYKARRAQERA